VHSHLGRLVFADRLIDPTTGTLLVEIAFPNPERLVRPGGYGRARVTLESLRNALLVPQKAVAELQATYSVAVVTADNKVESRPVSVGPRVGVLWVIEKGLKPDDRVVVEGAQKIRPGMVVKPTLVEIKEPPVAAPARDTPGTDAAGD
jgi:membrane fusion protein, multidrug efflux system